MKLPPGYVPGSGVYKASGFGGFGERLLRKHGWQKGEGLGKDKSGRAEAIEVKKKEDTVGIGGNKVHFSTDKWWEGAFDTALNVVNHKDSDSDTDSDASTAEDVVVTIHNSDGTSTSAQQHELAIAAELAKQPAWFGGGRFSGREGKMARIRQQEALAAAKLGLACPKAELVSPAAAPKVSKKQQVKLVTEAAAPKVSKKRKAKLVTDAAAQLPLPTTAAGVAVPEVSSGKQKSSKKQKSAQAMLQPPAAPSDQEVETAQAEPVRKRIIIEPAFTPAPAAPFIQTPASGWWGAKKFTSAGCLEGAEQEKAKASERQQFDEDDQTNLYMAAHNLKTQNKKGLGTKSQIGKVAGAKWEGSKTVFDDTADGSDHISTDGDGLAGEKQSSAAAGPAMLLPDIKWKKLAVAELMKADKRQMKTKQLHKALVQVAVSKHNLPDDHRGQLLQQVGVKLASSSQFSNKGKYTSLVE